MIKWAKELLREIKLIRRDLDRIAECVKKNHHGHGDTSSLSTKHWNE